MNATDNPYTILGVSQDADEEKIRKAYRKAAKLHHPDKQTNEEDRKLATKRFVKIADAYALLNDPVRRYDWTRAKESKSSQGSSINRTSSAKKSSTPPCTRQTRRTASFGPGQSRRSSDASVCSTSTRSAGSAQSNSSTGRRKSRISVTGFTASSPQPGNERKIPTKSGSNTGPKRPSYSPSGNTVHKRPLKKTGSNPMPRRAASLGAATSAARRTKPTVGSPTKPKRPSQPSSVNSPPRRSVSTATPNPIQRAGSLGSDNMKTKPATRVSVNTIPRRTLKSATANHASVEKKGRKKSRISLNGSGAVPLQGRRVPPAA